MPESRKRKKKKKQNKPPNVKKYDEVFDGGWYEVARKGNNVFTKIKMTDEQHSLWMKQIEENVPLFFEEIKNKIQIVVDLINQYDKVFVLGGVASLAMSEMNENYGEDNSDPEVAMEYCQSIALSTKNVNANVIPSIEVLNDIYLQLKQIRSDFGYYYDFQHIKSDGREIKSSIRSNMIKETLIVRGEGYLRHIEELFNELFSPHDPVFLKHYGFKSSDILKTFKSLEYSFCLRVTSPSGEPHPTFLYHLNQWQFFGKGNYPDDFIKGTPGLAIENGMPALYSPLNIPDIEKLYRIRHFDTTQEKVVKALALEFEDNKVFADHSPYEVLNESKIFTKPVVKGKDGNYYLFSMNLAARNYQEIAINLLRAADSDYFNKSFMNNRVLISKDNFVENKVLSLFRKMLPDVEFFPNVKYHFPETGLDLKCAKGKDGKYELDILGISSDATYVIEVKAGLLNEKSKRGAVLSLQSDLTKLIGEAICQSYRAYQFVGKSKSNFTTLDGNIIEPKNRTNVHRISVSFSYVGGLLGSLSKLQEFGVIEENAEFAWTINIHDLIVFANIIASEEEFIDYLHKRIPLYQDKRLVSLDETALLGLYYSDDLEIHKDFNNYSRVLLNAKSYTREFDAYFETDGPKPAKIKKKI